MKRFITIFIVAIVALFAPAATFALNPELKELQSVLNEQCPMVLDEGLYITKFVITEDNTLQFHIKSQDLAGYTKDSFTAEDRKDFRNGFLSVMGTDNDFAKICNAYGLKLMLVLYNPSGQELFRETFRTSDYK